MRCPARSRRRSSPSGSRFTRSTPAGSPARPAWPGGPTPCCRPASSPSRACCPGTRRSPRSSRRSPRPTAAAAPRWSSGTTPRSTAPLAGLHQIEVPGRVTSARELPAMVPASAPEFVRTVTAEMMAGRGDDLPVSALPVDGTYPSGTAAYEKRNISELVAEWDPGPVHPVRQLQLRLPAQRDQVHLLRRVAAGGGATGVPVGAAGRPRAPGHPLHAAGLRGGLHRLRAVRAGLPGRGAGQTRNARRSTSRPGSRWWPPSGRTSRSSRRCRWPTGPGWTSAPCAARSSCSRCSSSPAPARAAARRRTSSCCRSCSATG